MRTLSTRWIVVVATMATMGLGGVLAASPASAQDYTCSNHLCNTTVPWGDNYSISDIWYRTDSGYSQALANMQLGGGYVKALAQCENSNWILSNVKSYDNSKASHVDCGSAGYRNTLYGNGAVYFP